MDKSRQHFPHSSLELDKVLNALFHTTVEGILVVNEKGEICMANQRSLNLLEYSEAELLNQPVEVLIPARVRAAHPHKTAGFFQNPNARVKGEGRFFPAITAKGEELMLEISLDPVQTEEGIYVVVHLVDVSRQLRSEQELQESKIRLSSIIETAVDGIITISTEGIIETINPAAARLFGYTPEEVIGRNINILMPAPYHEQHDRYIQNYRSTGERKIIGIGREVKGRKKNGSTFPFYLSVSEVKLNGRKIFTGIIHDLTQQKAAEAALKNHTDQLEKRVDARTKALNSAIKGLENEIKERTIVEQKLRETQEEIKAALAKEKELNELKSRFVSMASHEFRTPLATILSSLSLLGRYTEPEQADKRQKHFGRIRNNVHNLTGILNDFLSLSKLEEGQIQARMEWFDINELCEELCEEMLSQAKRGQTIRYQSEGAQQIYLDPTLLRNILVNLLNNAVKYSPEETPIVLQYEQDEGAIRFSIIDQGIGIPQDDQIHMFERFFRAKNVTNIQGTGLGLSIVRRYATLMQGTVSFESVHEHGTTFYLHFPRSNEPQQ
ncbi:MAG: PAS domain S-box protein [Bacteroidota bacterium]